MRDARSKNGSPFILHVAARTSRRNACYKFGVETKFTHTVATTTTTTFASSTWHRSAQAEVLGVTKVRRAYVPHKHVRTTPNTKHRCSPLAESRRTLHLPKAEAKDSKPRDAFDAQSIDQ